MSGSTGKTARFVARSSGNAGWRPNSAKTRSVGEFLPSLMRPAFEKYGFSSAAILTDWAALAGPELAAYTAPERLKWPRQKPGEEGKGSAQQTGATLVLRVVGARALEVEHRRPQIIERLNASFGYRAVAEIRLVQAPLEKREIRAVRTCQPAPKHAAGLESIGEERLRSAIARLASGIEARQDRTSVKA
jgi:hypothetical protein